MEQITTAIVGLLVAVITALIGVVTRKVTTYLANKEISAEIAAVTNTAVRAVEQIYKDLHGDDKLNKAKEYALELLNERGIAISEIELDLAIHKVVQELNQGKEKILKSL